METLSDKDKTAQANGDNILTHMYYEEDVKQFIKDLKEKCWDASGKGDYILGCAHETINKLAGDKLI